MAINKMENFIRKLLDRGIQYRIFRLQFQKYGIPSICYNDGRKIIIEYIVYCYHQTRMKEKKKIYREKGNRKGKISLGEVIELMEWFKATE